LREDAAVARERESVFGACLGLLRINSLPQQISAQDGTAIIDDRRSLGESLPRRRPRRCWVGDEALATNAAPARGLILDGPFLPAIQSAA